MKPITNILLVVAIVSYVFLPIFNLSFEGGWTGFTFTAETISNADEWLKKLFSLLPFLSCFGAIALNCMKNRFWGISVSVCILFGLYFYVSARGLVGLKVPTGDGLKFNTITSLGFGFDVGYGLMIAAFVSAVVSVLPFRFNRLHELLDKKKEEGKSPIA